MRALLDINVIIALLDAGHLMHRAAQRWMARTNPFCGCCWADAKRARSDRNHAD